jgi:HEAT repeat protein
MKSAFEPSDSILVAIPRRQLRSSQIPGLWLVATLVVALNLWPAIGQVTTSANVGDRLTEDDILKAVSRYHFGDSRSSVLSLEQRVAAVSNDPGGKSTLAGKLATMLSSDATVEARQIACWQLSLIGSEKEVPVLAKLVADKNLGYYARLALERIPALAAESALLSALKAEKGDIRRDIINLLAARKSGKAVTDIAKLLEDADPLTMGVAIDALGQIGGAQAASALTEAEARIPSSLKPRLAEALLRCAEAMVASGNLRQADPIFVQLCSPDQPVCIRMAAFPARVDALGEKGSEVLLGALSGTNEVMQAAAVRALRMTHRSALAGRAAEQLERLSPGLQVQLITLLGDRGEATAVPALIHATSNSNSEVKQAAIAALGLAGDASTIPTLVVLGAAGTADEKRLVVEALARLRGNDVDASMTATLRVCPPNQQQDLIRALVLRQVSDAVPVLIELARAPDSANRKEAITAAGNLGQASACAGLAHLLETEPETTASALAEICRRAGTAEPMLRAISSATPAGKASLLEALASIGSPQALEMVLKALNSDDVTERMAAVRSLANWPDAAPLDELVALSKANEDPKRKALALRGVARLAPMAKDRSPEKRVEIITAAMKAGGNLNEQKALLAALGDIPGDDSLKAVQAYASDPELGPEAKAALERIQPGHANIPGTTRDAAKPSAAK